MHQKIAKPFESYDINDDKVVVLKVLDLVALVGAGAKGEICEATVFPGLRNTNKS